ncbi:MAG: 3-dehydroquinate synthase [Planctomycetaceae bacterium]
MSLPARFVRGAGAELPALLRELRASGAAVVADARVLELHPPPCAAPLLRVTPGEANKNLEAWRALLDGLLALRLDRDGVVVAFGGGVALDLAGFAAACYLRGVRWIAVPTTLLAQVDAAHGGKTGVDLEAAKNLVGAFHPPEAVLVDPDYLATLPPRELRCGLAEVVKHAVIGSPALLARAGRDDPATLVEEAARIKLALVAKDPLDRGERRLLNLGHTLGHAFERASNYTLAHGEAVAVGLRAACEIAERHCGFAARAAVEEALDRCGLPARAPAPLPAVRAALAQDKKRAGETLRFVLPVALGEVRLFEDVPLELVSEVLKGRTGA